MSTIKILRLKNGDDIIGTIYEDSSDELDIVDPMYVALDVDSKSKPSLIMAQWLPSQLLQHNQATLKYKDILTSLEPSEAFVEYYMNLVEKLHTLLEQKEQEVTIIDKEDIDPRIQDELDKDRILH